MSIFRKKKPEKKPIEEGYNAEFHENVKFIDLEKTKKINEEIDRLFEEKPLKLEYPDFKAVWNEETEPEE